MLTLDPIIFKLESQIPHLSADEAVALFDAEAKEHNLVLASKGKDQYRIETPMGMIDLLTHNNEVRLKISSPNKEALYLLKEGVDDHIGHSTNHSQEPLQWCGDLPAGETPPNFREVSVVSTQLIGRTYVRVTVQGKGIERFFDTGMHFRLVFPKQAGSVSVWPYLDDGGRTVWPKGEQELMRPVYTVRKIDDETPAFDFDVFLHEGGPTADWARQAKEGDKVGLMGPSGGWIPEADNILIAGDETAIPAICRILETIPSSTKGTVFLSIEKEGDQIPVTHSPSISVEWVIRDGQSHDGLLDRTKKAELPEGKGAFVWFAAKKSVARKAKHYFRDEKGFNTRNSYIAGYWEEV
jgi:NADPH-dependent ferric siderophore reductase